MKEWLTSVGCALAGVALYWSTLGAAQPRAYLFPRVLAATMIALGVLLTLRAWRVRPRAAGSATATAWMQLWPGLLGIALYLALARTLGFYVSAWLFFTLLAMAYTPRGRFHALAWRAAPIAAAFVALLYVVFALILQVQLPSGVLF